MRRYLKTWFSKLAALAILLWLAEPLSAEEGGSGAILGDLEGTDIGAGPAVALIHTTKSFTFSAQVQWRPELGNRAPPQWRLGMFSLGLQF
jgi:hypothetical protein